MKKLINVTVFLGRLDSRIARLVAITVMKILTTILTLGILGSGSTAHAVIPASQRAVLTDLYTSTNGASWTNKTNWNGAVGTECTWYGITCDAAQSNVVAIGLVGNGLEGMLPALSGLPALQVLGVGYNQLTGPIPSLSGLTALQSFYGPSNQLTGPFPSLIGLSALLYFDVASNLLTGPIPPLSGLTALQDIYAFNNQLTGPIPSLIGLTALQRFYADTNQLTGPIPSLSGLTALLYFDVGNNLLTGPVPAPPTSLVANGSGLCNNNLTTSGVTAIDTAWNTATGVDWQACHIGAAKPTCYLRVSPISIAVGGTAKLLASCTPTATSFAWSGGTCVGTNATTCTVAPSTTTLYTFTGSNVIGTGYPAFATVTVNQVIPASQRAVLTNLYSSTNGASWTNKTNWNGDVGTECSWFGVQCDLATSNVVAISLRGNNLIGTLPALSGLQTLQIFDVNSNQLTGSIPTLSGLTALQYFDVSTNQLTGLTGPIPSLSGLTALQNFNVYNNQLTGPIPSLSGLTALQSFQVSHNKLTGPIPSLSGLTALQYFDVNGNQLSGIIPSLSGLTALRDFQVYNNQLTGSIPSLSGLTALQNFYVHNNQLTGPIPSLSGLTALLYFGVNNNQLAGPVPAPPASLVAGPSSLCSNNLTTSGVAAIDAAWNTATGGNWQACQIGAASPSCTLSASPASITAGGTATLSASCSPAATSYTWTGGTCVGTNATTCTVTPSATTTYTFRGSNVVGAGNTASATIGVRPVIPTAQRTALINIYTSTNGSGWTNKANWNGAVGTECTWFGVTCDVALNNVVQIDLRRNNLAGILPVLSGLPALLIFDASNNLLTGPIPSLSGLTALLHFDVTINQLTGPILSLSGLMALQKFYVSGNQLTGPIPSLSGLTSLRFFYASDNQLTGPIPSLTALTTLEIFQVGHNQLTGPIPSLSGLTVLHDFYVNNNLLTGPIPSLSGLARLQYFDVSSNQLAGPVPAPPTFLSVAGLCSNRLTSSGVAAIDAAWNTATGVNWLACQTGAAPPSCNLSASPALISAGSAATLSATCTPAATSFTWTGGICAGTNATTCTVTPTATSTYTFKGTNSAGTGNTSSATVTVQPSQTFSCTLTASPPTINAGGSSTLTTSCSSTPTSYLWTGGSCAGTTGATCIVTPSATTEYTVTASAGGQNFGSVAIVTVTSATAPACGLIISASTVTVGRSATLTAICSPAATAYSWTGGTCPGTFGPTCVVTPAATTTYTVTGSNAGGPGKPVSGTVTLVVPVFPMTVANTITLAVANVAATLQYRQQDVPAVNNVYAFALAPASLVKNVPATALSSPSGPVVASSQAANGPAACVLAQFLNGELTFASTSTLQPSATGVSGNLGASVSVLNGVSTALVGGAVFYVGYGTDPNAMIVNGTNLTVATLPGVNTCLPQTPQSGWWWYPAQDGRGFGIEVQGNNMFMSGYLYDSTGRATWMVAEGKVSLDGAVFSNKLYQVANGQTLTGTYKAPGSITFPGDITLSFTTARSGTLTWPGGIIPIQRFDDVIGSGNGVTPAFVPETGWWWNATESGRGYFIEIKNNYAFIAGYMYEADGRPVWYIAEGAMSTPQLFSSKWYEAANGQTLTGAYKKPNILNGNIGAVSIQFLTTTTATLTLPDGRLLSITRQRY